MKSQWFLSLICNKIPLLCRLLLVPPRLRQLLVTLGLMLWSLLVSHIRSEKITWRQERYPGYLPKSRYTVPGSRIGNVRPCQMLRSCTQTFFQCFMAQTCSGRRTDAFDVRCEIRKPSSSCSKCKLSRCRIRFSACSCKCSSISCCNSFSNCSNNSS